MSNFTNSQECEVIFTLSGIFDKREIKFKLMEGKDQLAYNREVRGLKQTRDNFTKKLLTEDHDHYNDDGIEQINVIDWLLSILKIQGHCS